MVVYSQPPPPPGGGNPGGPPCPPFSPCWCDSHPSHPRCNGVGVPINSYIWILILAGGGLAIYYKKRIEL